MNVTTWHEYIYCARCWAVMIVELYCLEYRFQGGYVSLLRRKTVVLVVRLWRISMSTASAAKFWAPVGKTIILPLRTDSTRFPKGTIQPFCPPRKVTQEQYLSGHMEEEPHNGPYTCFAHNGIYLYLANPQSEELTQSWKGPSRASSSPRTQQTLTNLLFQG